MTDSPVVGSAAFELRARRDQLKKDLDDAERDLKQFVDKAEAEGNRGAAGVGRAAKAIGIAVAALTAVFAAAITGAFALGRASLQMAEDLSNGARRIGISTTALQEWQYVARKTGEDAGAVAGALDAFADRLAGAASRLSKEDVRLFRSIGLEPEDLRKFESVEEALDNVVDRIGALRSESDRAAVAERMGLGPLSTALREGSDEVVRLRDEAARLGFVLDEDIIRKGAAASEQMDDLSRIIGIQMAEAFISLSDEVLAFTGHVAGALRGLNDFIEGFDRWRRRANAMYGDDYVEEVRGGNPLQALISSGRAVLSGRTFRAARDIREGNSLAATETVTAADLAALADPPRDPTRRRPNYNPDLTVPTRAARERIDRSAEREARRAERVEQEIFRARQRLLQVAEDDLLTAQQRFDLAQQQLRMDREARDAEIESKANRGEIKAAERRQLEAANAEADALEDRVLADNAFREIQDERLANERLLANLTADLVSLQVAGARTAVERRRLELELLEITQRQRREALQIELDRNPSLTPAQRAEAMQMQERIERLERDAISRRTMSPLEQWRDQSLRTAGEISQAYESVAARGLDALNDGLVNAIMNTRDLGDVFRNVSRQIIADLLQIDLRRSIVQPLANFLFGNGKGGPSGASNLLSAIGGWFGRLPIPGFSSGVSNFSGGLAYVHQGEVLANLAPGTDVIPAHAVGRGGNTYNFTGNLMTPEFWARIQSGDRQAAMYGERNGALGGARIVSATAEQQQRQTRAYKR